MCTVDDANGRWLYGRTNNKGISSLRIRANYRSDLGGRAGETGNYACGRQTFNSSSGVSQVGLLACCGELREGDDFRSPVAANRFRGGLKVWVRTTAAPCRASRGPGRITAARGRIPYMRITYDVCVRRLQALAASECAGGADEAAKDRLRHDHSALAGCRRHDRGLHHRTAYRKRIARSRLAQLARRHSAARQCLGAAHGSGDRACRGVGRLRDLYDPFRTDPAHRAGQDPVERSGRSQAGEIRFAQRAAGLDVFCHDADTDRQRRAALFRSGGGLRRHHGALVRELGHPGLCGLSCADPLRDRKVVTIAQDFPS